MSRSEKSELRELNDWAKVWPTFDRSVGRLAIVSVVGELFEEDCSRIRCSMQQDEDLSLARSVIIGSMGSFWDKHCDREEIKNNVELLGSDLSSLHPEDPRVPYDVYYDKGRFRPYADPLVNLARVINKREKKFQLLALNAINIVVVPSQDRYELGVKGRAPSFNLLQVLGDDPFDLNYRTLTKTSQ
jgi:hypothetical protein